MTSDQVVALAVALLAGSELLALFPSVKANSWTQLALAALRGIVASQSAKRK